MATPVTVPNLGESVTEATILKWHAADGARVSAGDALCELETDKANVDVPAPVAGVVKRAKGESETVKVGEAIASIEEGAGAPQGEAPPQPQPKLAEASDQRPSVRRIAEEKNVDLSQVKGTARGGQITKEDVEKHLSAAAATLTPAAAPERAPELTSDGAGIRREPMSRIRKRIAQNLVQAQQTAAILHTWNEVDLSAVQSLRARYKESFEKKHGVGLGLMSFFCSAVTKALAEFPAVNAFLQSDEIVYHDYVNLGIAVSTDRGLVVPVLRGVEKMGFAKIEKEIKRVATAARDGKLGLEELSGGTFTITNGGVFGSLLSAPILLPPQSAILGMHTIKKRPVVVDDQVVVHPMMYLVLGYDHRIIDGRDSVSFLVRVKEYLEDPSRLMLEV